MDNRKIIIASYLTTSMVVWYLTRASIQFFYLTFYQVRRFPAITAIREVVPVLLAVGLFVFLFRNPKSNSFLDEVVAELRKVTWPSRDDVVKSTTVVLICIMLASFILAGFDFAWGKIIGYLLHS